MGGYARNRPLALEVSSKGITFNNPLGDLDVSARTIVVPRAAVAVFNDTEKLVAQVGKCLGVFVGGRNRLLVLLFVVERQFEGGFLRTKT